MYIAGAHPLATGYGPPRYRGVTDLNQGVPRAHELTLEGEFCSSRRNSVDIRRLILVQEPAQASGGSRWEVALKGVRNPVDSVRGGRAGT